MNDVVIPFNDLRRQYESLAPGLDEAIQRTVRSGRYVLGPECAAFESEFAEWCGVNACVGVANGTDALELALRSVGVTANDEVITAANAGGYVSLACSAIGAVPVYVDIDEVTLGIDPLCVSRAVSAKTAAIVVTHLYGIAADVDAIRSTLPRAVAIVEDGAQAHGARRAGRRVGSLGDIAAFSFYPTKNLGAMGDGGAVVSNRVDLIDRVRSLAQYGWVERNDARVPGGRNSRLDELQAAVLRHKLPFVDAWNDRRRAIADRWRNSLTPAITFVASTDGEDAFHLCVARTNRRDQLRADLHHLGVTTAVHFAVPDYEQPAFADLFKMPSPLPITASACDEVLSLPCFPELRDDELDRATQIALAVVGAS